jgi:hypothetical protein
MEMAADYHLRSTEGNFWYERVGSRAAVKEQERNLVEGCYYTPGVKKHNLRHDLICFCNKGNIILDKLPFWKLTTLGATATQTRKLHQEHSHPPEMCLIRQMSNCKLFPNQSAQSSHSGHLWICHASWRVVLGGFGINGLLFEQ